MAQETIETKTMDNTRQAESNKAVASVSCPACKASVAWVTENTFRPFCSESCKNKDFVGWANEEKRLQGSADYDDIFSESAALENIGTDE